MENQVDPTTIETFEGLSILACSQLRILGQCETVCGPISTGGRGSVEANLKVIEKYSEHLRSQGRKIFDNCFYENFIFRLKERWLGAGNSGYCMPILEEFYFPIYCSGFITRAYFLPDWESSFGSRWERRTLPGCGVEIVDVTREEIDAVLNLTQTLV